MDKRVHWSSVREDPCCLSEGPQVGSSLGHHTFCSSLSMFLSAEMMVRSPSLNSRPRAPAVCQVQYCGFCPHIKCCSAPSASSGLCLTSVLYAFRLQGLGGDRMAPLGGPSAPLPPFPFWVQWGKTLSSVFSSSPFPPPPLPLPLFLPLPLLLPFSTSKHQA